MREAMLTRLARFAVRSCLKPALQPSVSIAVQRRWASIAARTLSVPFGVRFSRLSMGAVPAETVRSRSNTADSANAVLFLHGGAFIIGSPVSHRSITGRLAQLTGANVFVPDYRLAPEYPFPAALEDVLACYRVLLMQGYAPAQIAVAGDSAGGGLVLSLCLQLGVTTRKCSKCTTSGTLRELTPPVEIAAAAAVGAYRSAIDRRCSKRSLRSARCAPSRAARHAATDPR
jgi:epsilon-lactone hydrolase